jgi:hypothetical protein
MKVQANACMTDLESKVQLIAEFRGKTFGVFSEDELVERTKGIGYPCIGVIYNGIYTQPEIGSTQKIGGSGELVFSMIVVFRQSTIAVIDPKEQIVEKLDAIRSKIIGTKSPTGHFWKFQMEIPVVGKAGLLAYVQRWATPVQLV